MKRVIVMGCAGSGKSTFSRELSDKTGLPLIHLDSLYWKPGWQPTPNDEWDQVLKNLIEQDKWIIDGNYSRTLDLRLSKSDTVIFFDFTRYLCLYRVVKRRVQYHGKTRKDMGEGCDEKIDPQFLKWVWNFRKNNRPKILMKLDEVQNKQNVIILRTPKDVRHYLAFGQLHKEAGSN